MYALVDCVSYYCSAESIFRPDLRGRPVVVLSNNDGCIVAASPAALALGIKKFRPYFKMRDICEGKDVTVFSSNYELYSAVSAKVMAIISGFAPRSYIYSIDEVFLQFDRCASLGDLEAIGHQIRRTVWKEAKIPVGFGAGQTLTLAKCASHACRKIAGLATGSYVIDTEQKRRTVLQKMSIDKVWGIGSRLTKHLNLMNIHTAWQLANMPPKLARKRFSVELERTIRELNNERCKGWDEARADKQQIFSTRSVGRRITDPVSIKQALSQHASIAGEKLRKQGSLCGQMLVFAHASPFDNDPGTLIRHAGETAEQCFRSGIRYYKIGIGLLDLSQREHFQGDLFAQAEPDDPVLMATMDGLNRRLGRGTLFLASQGIEQKWRMRRDLLSPRYMTRWADLPRVKC
jgi:DNA polymerase V